MGIVYKTDEDELIQSFRQMPKLSNLKTWESAKNRLGVFIQSRSLDFTDWLMENCELSEDNSLWSYDSEDYTNEKLYEIFLSQKQLYK